jgi:hypothetical protein
MEEEVGIREGLIYIAQEKLCHKIITAADQETVNCQ